MLWETVTDPCDVCQCTRLFKNAFKIKSTPEGAIKSRVKDRRVLDMTVSRRICTSPETVISVERVDKENAADSPQKIMMNSSSANVKSPRLPLEDCHSNSQDSGYNVDYHQGQENLGKCQENFRFTEPLGVPPKKMSSAESPIGIGRSPRCHKRSLSSKYLMKKLSSGYESTDDDFNDLLDMETLMEGTTTATSSLPNDMNKLISGDIMSTISVKDKLQNEGIEKPMETDAATTPEFARTRPLGIRRSIPNNNDRYISKTPPLSRVRSCLFRSPNATSSGSRLCFSERQNDNGISPKIRSFKRPDPPASVSPTLVKRLKKNSHVGELKSPVMTRHLFQRSHSETEAHAQIKSAIHRSTTDSDLTGDFSKTCILPLAEGHHEDLKSISVETLAGLIRNEFIDTVGSFKIVDCRYPYEYEAGHINGAMNLYTKELIEQYLMNPFNQTPEIQPDTNKRNILIFHCEFSWERGPNLSRYLRNIDRKMNKEYYPALYYPEVYLLHGGYQQFYQREKQLCTPQDYRPMTHPDHEADLRKFRNKSKSWQGEKSRNHGFSARTNLKRLGL